MAGWSISDWQHADWAAASVLNEFVNAIKERQDAPDDFTPAKTVSLVSAGDDVQSVSFWQSLQEAVEELVAEFVDKGEASGGDFDNYASATIPLYSLANWRGDIGLTGAGFRRATSLPTDWTDHSDAAYSHGLIQAGDIIGPWLLKDLQDGLNLLAWTKRETDDDAAKPCCWSADGTNNHEASWGSDNTSWANAYTEAETYWGTHTAPYSSTSQVDFEAPYAIYWGYHISVPVALWSAYIEHLEALIHMDDVPKTLNGSDRKRDVDFYCYSNHTNPYPATWVWDWSANGDDVLELKQSIFDTKAAQAGTTIKSDFLGDSDVMCSRCQDPTAQGGGGAGEPQCEKGYFGSGSYNPWKDGAGYECYGGTAVIRWNVTDGFDYY